MFYIHMYYLIGVFLLLLHIIYAYECDHFRDIQGGKIFYDEYNEIGLKVGTTAKLICGNGDVTTTLCTEEGWEPRSLGSCGKKTTLQATRGDPHAGKNALVVKDSAEKCVPLTSIQNGYVSYVPYGLPPYNSGTIATLGCVTGYAPVGPTIARCAQGSWTIIGDCQPIREQKCPPIATVYNGHISYTSGETGPYDYGAVAELTCNQGFSPSGNQRVRCEPNGWGPSPGIGRCQELPKIVKLIRVKRQFTGSGTCPTLYTNNGQITYLQANPSIPNSSGTSAILMCNLGFQTTGSSSSICQGNVWSPQIGQCIQSGSVGGIGGIGGIGGVGGFGQCTAMPMTYNGQITYTQGGVFGPYPSGTMAMLQCNPGYTVTGSQSAYCQSGQWSPPSLGQCAQNGIGIGTGIGYPGSGQGCIAMLSPMNGNVQYNMQQNFGSYPTGTTASLTCNFGSTVSGSATTQCSNGQWYPPIGSCVSGGLGGIGGIGGGSQCAFGMIAPFGATIQYSNGGSSFGPYPSGTTANLICQGGTSLGQSTAYCQNGAWNPPSFQGCSTTGVGIGGIGGIGGVGSTQCYVGPSAVGGTVIYNQGTSSTFGPWPSGSIATLQCTGGQPQGSTTATCQNGQWLPSTLGPCSTIGGIGGIGGVGGTQCVFGLLPPLNGNIVYSSGSTFGPWQSGSVANLQCNSGYSPSGSSSASCINGQFTPSTLGPCVQGGTGFPGTGFPGTGTSVCYSFPTTLNGQITYSNGGFQQPFPIGTSATLTCNPGYNPIGSTRATCQQSGWDSFTMGTCIQNGIGIGK